MNIRLADGLGAGDALFVAATIQPSASVPLSWRRSCPKSLQRGTAQISLSRPSFETNVGALGI